jgi:hypothetical protein
LLVTVLLTWLGYGPWRSIENVRFGITPAKDFPAADDAKHWLSFSPEFHQQSP